MDETELEAQYLAQRKAFLPWEEEPAACIEEQEKIRRILTKHAGARSFGRRAYVSPHSHVYTSSFTIGDNSFIAGGAVVRGSITIGAECSINSFAHIAGRVDIQDGVRIAGLVSIYGFNHGIDRIDVPIYRQKHTSLGILIESGVWIGAGAVILDGVRVGCHSVVAAGAIVTKSIPPYSIAAGNPARVIRDRKASSDQPT